jgi:hypothetical protein
MAGYFVLKNALLLNGTNEALVETCDMGFSNVATTL